MLCNPPRQRCTDYSSLEGVSAAVKQNINDIAESGQGYVTPKVCRELSHIDNGVDHIRLDHDILKSNRWNKQCNPAATYSHQLGSIDTLQHATERLVDVKTRMQANSAHCNEDNIVRQVHHLTMQDLTSVEKDVRPYVHDSVVRLKQYCDDVGVTDRYTSYRHNLSRGSRQSADLAFSWYDPVNKQPNSAIKLRPEYDSHLRQSDCNGRFTHSRMMAQSAPPTKCRLNPSVKPLTIEEQAGINMTYPGTTEYTDRYATSAKKSSGDYVINPTPNYRIDGRPHAKQHYACTDTEYQFRYEWPDGKKIKTFPWQRQ